MSTEEIPTADLIIRTTDAHGPVLADCLESITPVLPWFRHKILVLDGKPAGDIGLPEWAIVRSPERRGAVWATNAGLALSLTYADTEWAFLLDDDVRAPARDTTWPGRWIDEAELDPRCAAAGATLSRSAWGQNIRSFPPGYLRDWHGGARGGPEVPAFVSAAVMLRKAAIRQCGLWDELYSPGQWEDTDYSVVLRRAGYTVRIARSVYFEHGEHRSFATEEYERLLQENRVKFLAKWGPGTAWDMGIIQDQDVTALLVAKRQHERGIAQ